MDVIRVASHDLFFKDVKPREKPLATLLLVHGAAGSHLSWRRQFDELSERFRIIAVDLPGHGLSEGAGEATISRYREFVAGLMDSLELEDVVLGGHSMGGAVALEIALENPGRLGGLVLVGTGARLRVLPAIFSMLREDYEVVVRGMARFVFGSDASEELVEEEKQLMANCAPEVILKDFTACDSFDVMEQVGQIKLPSLIVCGENDALTPLKYSEFLHDKIEESELVLFEQCGHMPMLEKSEEFNARVSSFLVSLT